MKTPITDSDDSSRLPSEVTLKWDGDTGDGKRAFVVATQNDGWQDLRIEVDTDDCDSKHAKAAMQIVIDRCNAYSSDQQTIKGLREGLARIIGLIDSEYLIAASDGSGRIGHAVQQARSLLT